jgi:hypothetical protein
VDPILYFSLSCDALLDVPCDEDDLSDNSYVVYVLKSHTCAEIKHVIHIANTINEHQLQCSIHTSGYIEFDILCNLDCLSNFLNMLICHVFRDTHTTLLANITTKVNI